eukprot:Tbor_TRINITY_DN3142_c0_g1::TRINITY_DN3142_c0_g1_i1::g.14660::m.14660
MRQISIRLMEGDGGMRKSRKAAVRLGRAYEKKVFNYNDTTNNVNRNSYTAAHLESIGLHNKQFDVIHFKDSPPVALPSQGRAQSSESADSIIGNMLWKSWELSHKEIPDNSDNDYSDYGRYLPKQWRITTLKYRVPLNHRLVKDFINDIIPRVRHHDSGKYNTESFSRWLGHRLAVDILPICSTGEQKSILLAYLLHLLGSNTVAQDTEIVNTRCLNVKLALSLYEILAKMSPDVNFAHLAILLHVSNPIQIKTNAKEILAVLKNARQYNNGIVDASLLHVTLVIARHQRLKWEDCLRLVRKADVDNISPACWGGIIKTVGRASGAPFEAVQKVVDYATEVTTDNMKNMELWNSYILETPTWEHAIEMVQLNMPHYQLKPNFNTLAAVLVSMSNNNKAVDSELYVKVFRRAMKLASDKDLNRNKSIALNLVRKMRAGGEKELLNSLATQYPCVQRACALDKSSREGHNRQ